MDQPDQPAANPVRVLAEAVYLAASWTWCIGMFLPVYLVRDFGWTGWLAFAIPNCLGAAACGWVLHRTGAPIVWATRHARAIRVFSFVTLAFQWFFLVWVMFYYGFSKPGLVIIGALVLFLGAGAWAGEQARRTRVLGAAIFAASLACAAWWFARGDYVPLDQLPAPALSGGHFAIAFSCALGFFLCPLLDATFVASAVRLPTRGSSAAFAIGFLAFFPLMIVFTLLYAPRVLAGMQPGSSPHPGDAGLAVGVHMALQLALTIFLHERSTRDSHGGLGLGATVTGIVLFVAAAQLNRIIPDRPSLPAMDNREFIYRCFMTFYALVAPAYVWIVALPFRSRGPDPTRGMFIVFALAVLAAAPCFWIAFIERNTVWAIPGVAIALAARPISRFFSRPGPHGLSGGSVPTPSDPPLLALSGRAAPDHREA